MFKKKIKKVKLKYSFPRFSYAYDHYQESGEFMYNSYDTLTHQYIDYIFRYFI